MVEWREMIRTAAASRKIQHELLTFEAVWGVAILVAHAGEIWSKPVCLRIGFTYTPEMHDGVLM